MGLKEERPELPKVFTWFLKKRQAGSPIDGTVLSIQAPKLHIDNPSDFVLCPMAGYISFSVTMELFR